MSIMSIMVHSDTTYLNLSEIGRQAAKRRRSEIWPPCISVQGHLGSNPSNASDRHPWVSYWHSIQTLVVSRTVWEIIAVKVGLFDAPLSLMIEKTRGFWTVANIFSERYNALDVIAEKIFRKSLTVSSQRAKTWRPVRKFDRFFDVFWPSWPGFWTFHKAFNSM